MDDFHTIVDPDERNIDHLWHFYDGHEKAVLDALLHSLVVGQCDLTLNRLVLFRNVDSLKQLCHPSLFHRLGAGGTLLVRTKSRILS